MAGRRRFLRISAATPTSTDPHAHDRNRPGPPGFTASHAMALRSELRRRPSRCAGTRAGPHRKLGTGRAWRGAISVEGRLLPEKLRSGVEQLALSRWNGRKWERIPFQVEERDGSGNLVLPEGPQAAHDESPGVLDENDLLVLSASDLGERSTLDGASEIRAWDPLTGRSGRLSSFRSRSACAA